MLTVSRASYESPIGWLEVSAVERGVRDVQFVEQPRESVGEGNTHLSCCLGQLAAYFAGKEHAFSRFSLAMLGTEFQQRVWDAALEIPFGSTRAYAELAERLGGRKYARAVARALGANPLLLIIPCHRVIASSGDIGGFSAGAWRKEWLLTFESAK
ncbi:MAG: methylated-DNA--[protein]-cysteine S-methyltransferase [Candidatus Peribacteraceae bacterium]|nr:methylated-DNA--[protein]-cysteine S-methyltransferase [Candidatus Peribacteraceae bacterium]